MSRSSAVHTDPRVLRPIVEALIFASEEPLPPRLLVRLLAGERDDPRAAVEQEQTEAPAGDRPAGEEPSTPDEADGAETAFPDEAVAPEEAAPVETVEEGVEAPAETVEAPAEEIATEEDVETPGAPTDDPAAALEEQRDEVGEGWLEREIGLDGATPDDGSEHVSDLAGAYVDIHREYSERLFPEEQIVTIDQRVVRRLIDDLNAQYEETGRAFRIVEVAGGFQFATIRDYGEYVALLSKEKLRRRLSPAALETLAIIAYRQPISKPEIEAIRGVNSDQVLLSLLEKNLVAITGRSESVGRPLLYGTTDEFLRIFGLNSLNDLPKLREIEELMEDDAYSAEKIEVVSVAASSDAEAIEAAVGAAGHTEPSEDGTDENYADTAEDIDGPEDEVVLDDYERDEDTGDDDLLEEPAAVDLMLDEIDSEAEAMGAPGLTEDSATHVLDEIDALDQVDDVDGDSAE